MNSEAFERGVALAEFLEEHDNTYLAAAGIAVFAKPPTLPLSTCAAKGYLSRASVNFHGFDNEALWDAINLIDEVNSKIDAELDVKEHIFSRYGVIVVLEWSTWTFRLDLGGQSYELFLQKYRSDVENCFAGIDFEHSYWCHNEEEEFAEFAIRYADD